MPWRAQSAHIARVSIFSAPFDDVYAPIVSRPISLVAEQMLTILPRPRSIICGATARATRNALVTFAVITCSHSASENRSSEWRSWMPALLTRMSISPIAETPSATACSSVTSNGAANAPSMLAATVSHASGVRPLIPTRAPAPESARARASPMPRVDPVTRAVRPDRSKSSCMRDHRQQHVRRIRVGVEHRLPGDLHPRRRADVLAVVEVAREPGEARARDVEPQPVAALEDDRGRVAADPVLRDLARLEQLRRIAVVRVPVARAQDPLGDEDRRPVRMNVAQADDEVGVLRARRRVEHHLDGADH